MSLKGYTIITCEDQPDELEYLASVLEDHGARVLRAHNGNEAIELARGESPNLVTLDIEMPGMDVVDLLAQFEKEESMKDSCVCMISGRPELRRIVMDKFPDCTCFGFVDKPFSDESLIAEVTKLLKK